MGLTHEINNVLSVTVLRGTSWAHDTHANRGATECVNDGLKTFCRIPSLVGRAIEVSGRIYPISMLTFKL